MYTGKGAKTHEPGNLVAKLLMLSLGKIELQPSVSCSCSEEGVWERYRLEKNHKGLCTGTQGPVIYVVSSAGNVRGQLEFLREPP